MLELVLHLALESSGDEARRGEPVRLEERFLRGQVVAVGTGAHRGDDRLDAHGQERGHHDEEEHREHTVEVGVRQ